MIWILPSPTCLPELGYAFFFDLHCASIFHFRLLSSRFGDPVEKDVSLLRLRIELENLKIASSSSSSSDPEWVRQRSMFPSARI